MKNIKVKITTTRFLNNDLEYWKYIKDLNDSGIPLDGKVLLENGIYTMKNKSHDEDVQTSYEILDLIED